MVFIEGGKFLMGGDNDEARSDEYPKHSVEVSSFWMDETEVTNAQFKKFIDETGYVTTAERKIIGMKLSLHCHQELQSLTIVYWNQHLWFLKI